jgi:cell division protease FtsH
MGHALAATTLTKTDPVHKVSIIPRSVGALGYTLQRPTDDRFLITASELKERMTVLLAGRAAEAIMCEEVSTGASDDLAKATDIARQFVTRFGMSPALGQAILEEQKMQWLDNGAANGTSKDYSEQTAREVDVAIRDLIEEAYEAAKTLLQAHLPDLKAGAALLLERETVTPEDFAPLRRRPPEFLDAKRPRVSVVAKTD